ncbi:protein of unknown function [Cupriavidus taiwanensis]|uniref:Uncharacterized protein n=1 Tax=Cupriavidus taiwanensis TaxID=164546 RepID=A0A7Z7JDF2_9BURK|nr:protein of unknown function [Cupriavidus taiwanensis]SOZ03266.1 hypothetical protein CBM2597_A110330 [Cupriavidus taiwanensis]SPC19074.1 hypothetical protein CBM2594_A80513 [Cupriavidus taiwanensis]SPD41657.1 protein of unknown function [Cupriavidus taiwanensis]
MRCAEPAGQACRGSERQRSCFFSIRALITRDVCEDYSLRPSQPSPHIANRQKFLPQCSE